MSADPRETQIQRIQCVILAGGLATRMLPLTEKIPKFLLEIENDVPFADYQLGWLARHGVTDVVLCIGHQGALVREYVGDGSRWGIHATYVDEGENLCGTGGALKLAREKGELAESFFVTYGDSFLPIDFSDVWKSYQRCKRPMLMTVFRNQGQWDQSNVVYSRGQVQLYDKFRVVQPPPGPVDHIDYGLSAMTAAVIDKWVPPGKSDLAALFHGASIRGELAGHEAPERFYEIGSSEGLAGFRAAVLSGAFNTRRRD